MRKKENNRNSQKKVDDFESHLVSIVWLRDIASWLIALLFCRCTVCVCVWVLINSLILCICTAMRKAMLEMDIQPCRYMHKTHIKNRWLTFNAWSFSGPASRWYDGLEKKSMFHMSIKIKAFLQNRKIEQNGHRSKVEEGEQGRNEGREWKKRLEGKKSNKPHTSIPRQQQCMVHQVYVKISSTYIKYKLHYPHSGNHGQK